MNSKLYIPTSIKVGFQERKDTFTKKLAYVIYTDEKGKLRKEKSWDSWRDKKIEPLDLENKPYSGFTLNKGILRDGYWGGGHNMVRVYDDRGVEFEITVSNLLYILMGNDCNKRVLSGEFVYAWDGTELVLLPTSTEEYKTATEFTSLKTNKVTMKELQANVGCMFKTKGLLDWVYLGKLEVNEKNWNPLKRVHDTTRVPKHVFYSAGKFVLENNSSKLAYLIDDTKVSNFEELLETYFSSKHHVIIKEIILERGKDITELFSKENICNGFLGGKRAYFIDNKDNVYDGRSAQSVQRYRSFSLQRNHDYQYLYFSPMPLRENYLRYRSFSLQRNHDYQYLYFSPMPLRENYLSDENYEYALTRHKRVDNNHGYTEWNILNNGLRFNLLNVTLVTSDDKMIPFNQGDDISEYFFESNNVKNTLK